MHPKSFVRRRFCWRGSRQINIWNARNCRWSLNWTITNRKIYQRKVRFVQKNNLAIYKANSEPRPMKLRKESKCWRILRQSHLLLVHHQHTLHHRRRPLLCKSIKYLIRLTFPVMTLTIQTICHLYRLKMKFAASFLILLERIVFQPKLHQLHLVFRLLLFQANRRCLLHPQTYRLNHPLNMKNHQ